jgi:transposase
MNQRTTKIKNLQQAGVLNPYPKRVKASLFQNSIFFDARDFIQVKYEMLRHVLIEGGTKSEAAELFGVSRPTFYEAEAAFLQDGLAGLLPKQRGPKGPHKLDEGIMQFIEMQINKNRQITTKELVQLIQVNLNISVHQRSIERALARKKKQR